MTLFFFRVRRATGARGVVMYGTNFVKGPMQVQFVTLRQEVRWERGTLILTKGPAHGLHGGRCVGNVDANILIFEMGPEYFPFALSSLRHGRPRSY